MQHPPLILSNKKHWYDCLISRVRFSWPSLIIVFFLTIYTKEFCILALAFIRVSDVFYEPLFYHRVQERLYSKAFFESLIRFVVFILAVYAVLLTGYKNILFDLIFIALSNLIITLFILFRNVPSVVSEQNIKIFHDISLGVSACVASVVINIPRYTLSFADKLDLAFYSNILTCVLGGSLFYITLGNMLFAQYSKTGPRGFCKFLCIVVVISLIGIVLSLETFKYFDRFNELLIKILIGIKYVGYSQCLPYFSAFFFALFLQHSVNSIYISMSMKKFLLFYNIISAFILTIVLLYFVPIKAMDTIRATFFITISFLFVAVVHLFFCLKRWSL